jgi:hypothetical protein
MSPSDISRAMADLGYSEAQTLALICKLDELRKTASRDASAERQRKLRERNDVTRDTHVTRDIVTVTHVRFPPTRNDVTRDTHVTRDIVTENPPYKDNHASAPVNPNGSSLRSEPVNLEEKLKPTVLSKSSEVIEILAECLSAETAADLIAHRKAKKSQMTPGAAKGLVKAFIAFGDPEGAARAMMAQGWTGFKPEWMASQPRAGPRHANGRGGAAYMLADLLEKQNVEREQKVINPETPKQLSLVSGERSNIDGDISRVISGSFKRV